MKSGAAPCREGPLEGIDLRGHRTLGLKPHWVLLHLPTQLSLGNIFPALASMAQWVEYGPTHQRVSGSVPGQDTCLGFGLNPLGVVGVGS